MFQCSTNPLYLEWLTVQESLNLPAFAGPQIMMAHQRKASCQNPLPLAVSAIATKGMRIQKHLFVEQIREPGAAFLLLNSENAKNQTGLGSLRSSNAELEDLGIKLTEAN